MKILFLWFLLHVPRVLHRPTWRSVAAPCVPGRNRPGDYKAGSVRSCPAPAQLRPTSPRSWLWVRSCGACLAGPATSVARLPGGRIRSVGAASVVLSLVVTSWAVAFLMIRGKGAPNPDHPPGFSLSRAHTATAGIRW